MLRRDARTISGSCWAVLIASLTAAHCGGSNEPTDRPNASAGGSDTGSGGSTSNTTSGSSGNVSSTGTGGSNSGAGGASGNTTTPGTDVCSLPATTAMSPVFYDGANGTANCGPSTKAPHMGYWFSYNDKSADGGVPMTAASEKGGCGGATDCAFHTKGSGFTVYGAGVGFDLNDNAQMVAQPTDVSTYKGIQFWAKGSISGTRGAKYSNTPNSLHIKLATAKDRGGDDYGGYCTIAVNWTKCSLDFASATRDGFKDTADGGVPIATDMLDLNQMLKVQLEFSKLSDPVGATTITPVAFDVWIDNVSFY